MIALILLAAGAVQARIKLVALPERAATVIRLDNPAATLIEEERVLTLQKGLNKVDFSWQGVQIDEDSIRLLVLDHPADVNLLSVSYPPGEAALVWEISSGGDYAENVRISYLLSNIDRLITYKAVANKAETFVDLKSYLVLRNFSGEDFAMARVLLDYGEPFDQGIDHEETKQMLFLTKPNVPIRKIWTFDAGKLPWDPEQLNNENVGIPVSYEVVNDAKSTLGEFALWGGKARLFQDDGRGSTIFLGEDNASLVPVGEKMELYIGDSRDIVVTQRKMRDTQINLRKNDSGRIVLFDTDEIITAKIENFKDSPAVLTMIQHIPGQWEMEQCTLDGKALTLGAGFTKKDAFTLKFEIELPARMQAGAATKELSMHYHRRNVRPQ
ncbi:MAG: hypothetical protein A2Y77_17125 [Planctomycetes bacterium RBG_13_62_9]|nr:MAG: hypothetical protein A2Y77_17125 [Planctomycetes bacterium RBG_13_62_9]